MNDNANTQTTSKTSRGQLARLINREAELEAKLKAVKESKRKLETAKAEREASQNKKDRTRFLVLLGLHTAKQLQSEQCGNEFIKSVSFHYAQEIQKARETPQPPNKTPEEHKKNIDRKISTLANELNLIQRFTKQILAGTFK